MAVIRFGHKHFIKLIEIPFLFFVNLASIISEVKVALSITGSLMASKKSYGAATFYSVDYLSPDL